MTGITGITGRNDCIKEGLDGENIFIEMANRCMLQKTCVDCPRMQFGCNIETMLRLAVDEIKLRDETIFTMRLQQRRLTCDNKVLRAELKEARTQPNRWQYVRKN